MYDVEMETKPISKALLDDIERLRFIPQLAGPNYLQTEALIYCVYAEISGGPSSGYWEAFRLSNGTYYMALYEDGQLRTFKSKTNQYSGCMTADAGGIVATLMAFNRMAWLTQEQRFNDLFNRLKHYAMQHPEHQAILAAID